MTLALTFAASVGCLYRYHSPACKRRGAALNARIEKLKREAHEQLTIGTKKQAVVRFFEAHQIPVTFIGNEAIGTIKVSGCAPSGCGPDDASLRVLVKADENGTVVSEPDVGSIYTNCL